MYMFENTIKTPLTRDPGTDSIREMYVYTGQDKKVDLTNTASPSAQEHILMKLFRAQRNFYITGISLFLLMWVVYETDEIM